VIDVLYYRPDPSLEEHRPGWRERGRERERFIDNQ
jgi:hypothetical protein